MADKRSITIDDVDKRPPIPPRSPHAIISGADFDQARAVPLVAFLPWPAWVVLGVLAALFGGLFVYWLVGALRRWSESSIFAAWLALFVPAAAVGAFGCIALYWLAGKAYYSVVRSRASAYQAMLARMRLGTPIGADVAATLPVELVFAAEHGATTLELGRAPYTKYPVLASLTEGDHEEAHTEINGVPDEAQPAPLLPEAGPMLTQLRKRYAKSAEHLFVGTVGDTPIHLRWGAAGLSAIAGGSGGGKTNTTRLICAWHALNGGGLALCDGHGEVADESLIQSCEALAPAFVLPPAVKNADIAATIRRMDAIGRARLAGEPKDVPLLLVIDEFTSLCRNHGDAGALINLLVNFADEYRKVNMQALIIGHHWRGDLIDKQLGAALRSAIGARIIHTTAPEEAKFLLRPIEAQGVERLKVGEALYFDRAGDVQKIVVPWLPADTLREVAYPAHPGWPLPIETPAEQQRTPRQRSLDDIRRRMEGAAREERLRVAHELAYRGARQREIQYACCISDEAAGVAWRAAKNGNGVVI